MKYLTVSLYHPRVMKGGAQYVAKDLHDSADSDPEVEAIMLAGIDARMFPSYAKTGSSITALPDSRTEFLLPGNNFNDFHHVVYDPRRNKAIARFLEDRKPDVIHVHHSLWIGLEFLALARKVLPDVKIIYTLHEYLPICYSNGQLYRKHERGVCHDTSPDQCTACFPRLTTDDFMLRRRGFQRAFELVDHFVSPSAYLRERFIRWGLAPERISVIANGHKRSRPKEWKPSHSPDLNVFGYFGQFVNAKGIDVLLEAASKAARTCEIEVKIFGGNKEYATEDYVERINAIVEAAPDTLKISELGAYSRENVFDLMTTVDWVVVPSVWPETFGLVVSEAWDARRPVIASNVGGLQNRIVDQKNGILFMPGSSSQLSSQIVSCAGNSDLWHEIVDGIEDEISVSTAWQTHRKLLDSL